MIGFRKLYQLLMGNVVHSLGVVPQPTTPNSIIPKSTLTRPTNLDLDEAHDSREKALITVFGMGKDGRIAKEKACKVVKSLGLVKEEEDEGGESNFDIPDEELQVKEALFKLEDEEEDKREQEQLLRRAFMVFDEDGDGFIDAKEIKRVLVV